MSSAGLRPKSDCSGKAQKQLYHNLQTRPLVREGATKLQTCNCLKEISRRKQTLVNGPSWGYTPRHTDWLIVGRKVTLTLTLSIAVDCWLEVSCIRKFLRLANSIKVFRGFPWSQSKSWVGTQIPRCTACFPCSPPNGNIEYFALH
jgi:hypothetical protein